MALALNKILLANAVDNTAGAYFQNQVVNVAANSSTVLTAGVYYVQPTVNVYVQVQTAANTWANVTTTNVGGLFLSDGVNVRLANADTTNAKSLTTLTVNGGQAATGQFNS
ncbi:MAG: hypothetical protein EB117_15595 [Betaproteobacteria bacterium]|jgi:hypothetical protein|nr:hypothetical protein [Betaproteobacteria bacterium]